MRLISGLAAIVMLSGCAEGLAPLAALPAPETLVPEPTFDDALSTATPATPATEAQRTPLVAPIPDPDRLIGLSPAEIQDMIFPVSLIRRQEYAQVFQFMNEACVLDIYFYETAPGEGFAATHVEARDRAGGDADSTICLRELLSQDAWPNGVAARLIRPEQSAPAPDPLTPDTPEG